MTDKLPPLPPIDPKNQIEEEFIRIIPGYSRSFLEAYARAYAEEARKPFVELVTLYQHSAMTDAEFVLKACELAYPEVAPNPTER